MSLAGVAIAFSELVDASIVVVEQTHKKLELWEKSGRKGNCREIVLAAIKEVAGTTFFALLVIAVSFLPVLTLQAQEGRMFRPLAYTKTLTMLVAALLAIDRKSTRLNSSHSQISYAVFCLKKKKKNQKHTVYHKTEHH